MKNLLILLPALALLTVCQPPEAVTTAEDNVIHDGIRWQGEDEVANYLAIRGLIHFMNIEFSQAYTMSDAAVQKDSSLFASHTLLSFLSRGAAREHHKQMAKKFVANENETGKLFVSLLDVENDTTRAQRRAIWTKMRGLSNGPFIHHMYARFMDLQADTAAVLAELDNVIAFCNENDFREVEAATYNIKGYVLNMTGDLAGGTAAIDKYVELYPEGYNPIDSRAEFYLFAGDTANAILWYEKVLERYPYSQAARNHLEELKPEDSAM